MFARLAFTATGPVQLSAVFVISSIVALYHVMKFAYVITVKIFSE